MTATDTPTLEPSATATPTAPAAFAVIVRNPVNLRDGPGEGFDVVGQVISGQRYPVLARNASGTWWQIEVDGLAGWVFSDLVSIEGNPDGPAIVEAPVEPTALPPVQVYETTIDIPTYPYAAFTEDAVNEEYGWTYRRFNRADYEASMREFVEDDPLRADCAARLASLLRDAGQYDDAVEVLRDVLRVSGPTSRVYTELGLIYLAQERQDMVRLVLARAIELDAKNPAAYNALALLYLRQGRAQDAFDRFDYATSLDPDYLDARFNKAAVLLDAGDYQRAKAELGIIVDKKPDDLAAKVAYGLALRGLKDLPGAKKIWTDVVDHAPRRSNARADALYDLVILQAYFLEDVEAAKANLERYMQDAPTSHSKRQEAEEKRKELGL